MAVACSRALCADPVIHSAPSRSTIIKENSTYPVTPVAGVVTIRLAVEVLHYVVMLLVSE
jgi:hypothetical protein